MARDVTVYCGRRMAPSGDGLGGTSHFKEGACVYLALIWLLTITLRTTEFGSAAIALAAPLPRPVWGLRPGADRHRSQRLRVRAARVHRARPYASGEAARPYALYQVQR